MQNFLNDLALVVNYRFDKYFDPDSKKEDWNLKIKVPSLQLFTGWTKEEYIIFLIALAPHLDPNFFDQIIQQKLPKPGDFPQLGGVRGTQFRGFIPTGETVLFILAGDELEKRFKLHRYFNENHFFAKKQLLWLENPPHGEPGMCGKLIMSPDYLDLITAGKINKPKFGMHFPAQLIETKLEWKDLVLEERVFHQITDLEKWIKHGQTLLYEWNLKDLLKPGYRVLFYGPPGTGKTLAATLLGKYTGKDVYKIDLAMVVSKFIGETEKNLANLFSKAENKSWILFFDEADALFGKRTNVRDAHDKYANQEVSYLLQRIENYNGLVILASNFRDNMDDAFVRRFQSIIHFPMPQKAERLKIWKNAFPPEISFDPSLSLDKIAAQYEMTGANIVNVVQQVCLQALASGKSVIGEAHLQEYILREFAKEGKML